MSRIAHHPMIWVGGVILAAVVAASAAAP